MFVARFILARQYRETNRSCRLPLYHFLSVDIELIVRFRQRNVVNYQYRSNGPDVWVNLPPDEDDLSRVTSLQLYLENEKHCKHAALLLDLVKSLVRLEIQILDDSVKLLDTLLLLTRFRPHKPKSLQLDRFDFSDGVHSLEQLVEIKKLEELQLTNCANYRRLLRELKNLPLGLKTFRIHEYGMGERDFGIDSNNFIRSLDSLERVSLTLDSDFEFLDPSTLLDWSSLRACASMLKYLRLEYYSIKSPFSCQTTALDFSVFCKLAINLEQLSISGIDIGEDMMVMMGDTSEGATEDTSECPGFQGISHFLVSHV